MSMAGIAIAAACWAPVVCALCAPEARAEGRRRVAVLPFVPSDSSHPREGQSVALELSGSLKAGYEVVTLDWFALAALMEEHGLARSALMKPETLAAIGMVMGVDGVVSGRFSSTGSKTTALPVMVSVATGRVAAGRSVTIARDEVRDAVREYGPCEDAADRVDALERRILELKARYWALQLARGVDMRGLKFNPGSTISDPALKREFYSKMKGWTRQPIVPELSPLEIKEFAETEEKAVALARRCAIM
ncbi:MAG: hypothetical protein HY924_14635 [Elusimicrobia bacterium]|nr:hypothetical protein [Elusimicrobiota bacterium]